MKAKSYILTCVLLTAFLYLIAFTGKVPLFLCYVAIAYIVFIVITFIYLGELLLKFLPARLAEIHRGRQLRYFIFLLLAVAVFLFTLAFSRSIVTYQSAILRLFIYAGCFAYSAVLLRYLLLELKIKTLIIASIVFLAYLTVMSGWSSTTKTATREPTIEELAALPYVGWVDEKNNYGKTGVTIHEAAAAFSGVNLYAPNDLAEAFLVDMNGKVLHKWENRQGWEEWAHVTLNDKGDLLAIYKDNRLTKFAWDSTVLWRQKGRFHHDVRFGKDGNVYALYRKEEMVFRYFIPIPILHDYVVVLSQDGKIKVNYGLFDILKSYVRPKHVFRIYSRLSEPKRLWRLGKKLMRGQSGNLFSQRSPFDIFHTNSIEFVESTNGFFQQGNLLLSCRNISIVAVVHLEKRKVIWDSDQFTMQHQPSFLANGNILVFDNGLPSTGSRVSEINPQTKQIVWEYKAQDFYAHNRGGAQRLANGNTLITESPDGRAFEVTPSGKIVWEFFTAPGRRGKRSVIYRLTRFSRLGRIRLSPSFFNPSDPGKDRKIED